MLSLISCITCDRPNMDKLLSVHPNRIFTTSVIFHHINFFLLCRVPHALLSESHSKKPKPGTRLWVGVSSHWRVIGLCVQVNTVEWIWVNHSHLRWRGTVLFVCYTSCVYKQEKNVPCKNITKCRPRRLFIKSISTCFISCKE